MPCIVIYQDSVPSLHPCLASCTDWSCLGCVRSRPGATDCRCQGLQQQFGKAKQAVEERIFFERLVPPVGMESISYARFMELMFQMKVKRVIILSEGTAAIVEVSTF